MDFRMGKPTFDSLNSKALPWRFRKRLPSRKVLDFRLSSEGMRSLNT